MKGNQLGFGAGALVYLEMVGAPSLPFHKIGTIRT